MDRCLGHLDYLSFSRDYVLKCEERYGINRVESVLDAAHALMDESVNRYTRRKPLNFAEDRKREQERRQHAETTYNDLWRTVPTPEAIKGLEATEVARIQREQRQRLGLPEENILYFMEKYAPNLEEWERELCRIVRNIAQYYYPRSRPR